jgi:hypothetical protein
MFSGWHLTPKVRLATNPSIVANPSRSPELNPLAADIRRQRMYRMRECRNWRWHVDDVFVRINGERHQLWRAVDNRSEISEPFLTEKRHKSAALVRRRTATCLFNDTNVPCCDFGG